MEETKLLRATSFDTNQPKPSKENINPVDWPRNGQLRCRTRPVVSGLSVHDKTTRLYERKTFSTSAIKCNELIPGNTITTGSDIIQRYRGTKIKNQ